MKKEMRKKRKQFRFIILTLLMVIIVQLIPDSMNTASAALYKRPEPVQTAEQISSKRLTDEFYRVETPLNEAHTIYIEGQTKIKTERFCIRLKKHKASNYSVTVFVTPDENGRFYIRIDTSRGNRSVPEVIDGRGTVAQAGECYDTRPGYKPVETMESGLYHLTIARASTEADAKIAHGVKWYQGPLGGSQGYAYKEALLLIKPGKNNNPKLVKYSEAIRNNETIRDLYEKKSYNIRNYPGSYVRYQDPYMKDLSFVFRNPKTGKSEPLTSSRVEYLRKVAELVTAEATTDYDKLLYIYEYIAGNTYYDQHAFEQKKYQYANPYRNLYNLRNNRSSENSASDSKTKRAKVATTCQGYAAMVIALARACDIPARMAYGHHISQPIAVWEDKEASEISRRSHWWAEAFIYGEWIIIDANAGTQNKWYRDSFNSKGTWKKTGLITYAAFDPSEEQLSNSYSYNGIYRGSDSGSFINRKTEVNQLKAFLNIKSNGITNGRRLNRKYSATQYNTWGSGSLANFKTDGYGRAYRISWENKRLAGKLNLSGFSKLKHLMVYNNRLTALNLNNCSSLVNLSANYNKLTTFNGTSARKLEKIGLKGNRLTIVKFRHNGKLVTVQRNKKVGSFGFTYDKKKQKVTIYVNSARGHKYLGVYNVAGKKISDKRTYSFTPTGTKYYVKYQ